MGQKILSEYLALPYTIEFRRDGNGGEQATWFARVVELPGCMTEGDTLEEAATMIQDALAAWIEVALETGRPIPEPKTTEEYSGKFVVRIPKSLHRAIAETAEHEGVSLNQWVNVVLSQATGRLSASS